MTTKPIDPRPGQRLRQIREHRETSQGQFAAAIGVSVGTIQGYEHGRAHMTIERLFELAGALQCEPADLLMEPGSPLPRYHRSKLTPARPHQRRA
jgi:transcriptional regulator with XRE-family HTH domain